MLTEQSQVWVWDRVQSASGAWAGMEELMLGALHEGLKPWLQASVT